MSFLIFLQPSKKSFLPSVQINLLINISKLKYEDKIIFLIFALKYHNVIIRNKTLIIKTEVITILFKDAIYMIGNIDDQWLRHYTCSGFCKTSYHLLISPTRPTSLPNTLKIHTGKNKIDRQSRMWRQYTCYFLADGSTIPYILEELGNKHTYKLTHSLTDQPFYRVIKGQVV